MSDGINYRRKVKTDVTCLPSAIEAKNASVFKSTDVIEKYKEWTTVNEAERLAVSTCLKSGSSVIDVGCGAGRFFRLFQSLDVGSYIGIDVSTSMIEIAKKQYGEEHFRVLDALSIGSLGRKYDLVAFLHNGIDNLHPIGRRLRFFDIAHKSLRIGGVFVFSTHVADWLRGSSRFRSRRWNREDRRRLRAKNASHAYCEEQYMKMRVWQYRTSIEKCVSDLNEFGFRVEMVIPDNSRTPADWCYYVCSRRE